MNIILSSERLKAFPLKSEQSKNAYPSRLLFNIIKVTARAMRQEKK